jgi:hypothetical protein
MVYINILINTTLHNGENIKQCENCKRFIRQTSANKKYCTVCSKEIEKEKTRLRVEKHRDNLKCNGMENSTNVDITTL